MRANVKIAFDEPHLRALIRGGEVEVTVKGVIVRIILRDIGFGTIQNMLNDADDGRDTYKGYKDKQ